MTLSKEVNLFARALGIFPFLLWMMNQLHQADGSQLDGQVVGYVFHFKHFRQHTTHINFLAAIATITKKKS